MLRWTLALLVVANLLFLAWSRNGLASLGLGPVSESEPQRLQQQLRPEVIVLRPARPDAALPPPVEVASAAASEAAAAPDAASAAAPDAASAAPATAASAPAGDDTLAPDATR